MAAVSGLIAAVVLVFVPGALSAQECISRVQGVSVPGFLPNRVAGPVAWNGREAALLKTDSATHAIYFSAYGTDVNLTIDDKLVADSSLNGPLDFIWTGSGYTVFFLDRDYFLQMQRLSDRGDRIGGRINLIPAHFPVEGEEFDIAWTGSAFAVARVVPELRDQGLWMLTFNPDGTLIREDLLTQYFALPAVPRVAAIAPDKVALTWNFTLTGRDAIYYVPFDIFRGQGQFHELTDPGMSNSALVYNGSTLIVVFSAKVPPPAMPDPAAPLTEVQWMEVDTLGRVLAPAQLLLAGSGIDIIPLAFLWTGTEYALGYVDDAAGLSDGQPGTFRLARFSDSLELLSDSLFSADGSKRNYSGARRFVFDGAGYIGSISRFSPGSKEGESYIGRRCPFNPFFATGPLIVAKNTKVTFTAGATGGVAPYTFAWDLGDPNRPPGGPSLTTSFAEKGTYRVRLTATDNQVETVVVEIVVTVVDARHRAARH